MIFNTTLNNKDAAISINEMLGDSYSFVKAIKLGGVGSKRMVIAAVSPGFSNLINAVSDINYGNIELREKGILVHINKGLKNFSWAIPYYQLHTYKTDGFSIHAQGNFVRFENNKFLKENKKFIQKIVHFKIENDKKYQYY
jgi:L-asparaginase/Glu-tRNA(Gln) amidotransferase subunit D